MVPVEMRQKYFRINGRTVGFLHQSLPEGANAAAGIENHALVFRGADLKTRRVPAELQIFDLRRWSRTAHSPELEPDMGAVHCI